MESNEKVITKEEYEIEKNKLLVEYLNQESGNQTSRKNNIDFKLGFILVLTVCLLGMLLMNFDISNVLVEKFFSKNVFEIIYRVTMLCVYIANIVLCVVGIYISAISLINGKTDVDTTIMSVDNRTYKDIIRFVVNNNNESSKKNLELNTKLHRRYKVSSVLFLISLNMAVVLYLMQIVL